MTEPARGLPLLLEAVLSVGTALELRGTLQHLVESAAELAGAPYGAPGVVDPGHGRLAGLYTAGMTAAERQRIGRLPDGTAECWAHSSGIRDRCAWTS
ncbi:hypothetical protein ACF1G0_01190 [Streptomyces sp. NPDC013953]|uniref:hypothetical protein n=1 Tax=Streptomyces sp. NPDC013953 TaxID=3364868 RepID=UPI0036FB9991